MCTLARGRTIWASAEKKADFERSADSVLTEEILDVPQV